MHEIKGSERVNEQSLKGLTALREDGVVKKMHRRFLGKRAAAY